MDYFENIVKRLFEEKGYWVRQSVKVNLTKEDKIKIGKPAIPRPELDIVGYRANNDELVVLEVKSFLDSHGIKYGEIANEYETPTGRYKLFTCDRYRKIVFKRLIDDFVDQGLILKSFIILFGLAAGKIYYNDEKDLLNFFKEKVWILFTPSDIVDAIKKYLKSLMKMTLMLLQQK